MTSRTVLSAIVLGVAGAFATPVMAQSVIAVPESGTTDAGIASRAIGNVAANDTVNGLPATLGSSGNATVSVFGTWPAGISLFPATGTVVTAAAVRSGTYTIPYQLCDKSVPPVCATATDTVNVITSSIAPVADTGTAVAGTASTPIANVAANDSVNGSSATLGTSGNATVSVVGTWPAGITLNPGTGAVTMAATVAAGTYSLPYQLCDRNSPPNCAQATDTLTVITVAIVANPDSGSAIAGTASTPIANVAANDTINGAPAVVGTGGNATVSKVGTWPTGLSLVQLTGAVTTTAQLLPGTYTIQYKLCDTNSPPDCATTTDTVTVITPAVQALPDTGTADAGTASRPIANVAANDFVNGGPVTLGPSGNATISKVGTWPTGLGLDPGSGAVSTSMALAVGTYNVQYQLCNLATPPSCATAAVTVNVIASSILAVADSGTADAGIASRPIVNVAANDTVNGAPAVLGASGNATVAKVGTWPSGFGLDPTTGAVSTTVAVAAGTYSFAYQLCDLNSPARCANATDSVTVINSAIAPVAESGTADAGIASRPIANVAANDTVNGAAATLGAGGNATIAKVGTWPTGLGLNPTTGAVSTTISVAPGTYSIPYQLCDRNLPANCATATDTVTVVTPSLVVGPDSGTVVVGTASTPIANVVANDSVNGAPARLGPGGNASIAALGTWPSGLALNSSNGAVTATAALAAGTYTPQYQLCDNNTPANCAAGTITVQAISVSIIPNADSGTADFGIASRPIANVVANDSVNGSAAVLGTSGNATIAKVGTWPTGLGLNPTTGAVSTTVSLPVGTYVAQYQLCDTNTPANCATSNVTVTVISSSIVAGADSGTADAGIASRPIATVLSNDTVNGAPPTLGASGNAAIAKVGTWPTGLGLDPTTGAVSTTVALAAGTYTGQYQLCDNNVPANCATATVTVTVIHSSITPVAESGFADFGVASRPIVSVVANDTVNGAPATLGASGNATIGKVGTWATGLGLDPTSGAVSTTVSVPVGTYSISYQLCDKNSPANCATATDTVTVHQAAVVATPDSGSAVAGTASTAIINVVANDTVAGVQATLGSSGNSTISKVGTWPSGLALNVTTGAVTTTAALAAGTYSVQYQLCDTNLPAVCATATGTVTVTTPTVVAVPDFGNAVAGTASRPIANVAANDTILGAPATLGSSGNATVAVVGTWPTGITLSTTTGAVSTSANVPAGSYNIQYKLCDKSSPPVCATTTDTVTVITVAIVATPDSGTAVAGTASTPIANVAANDTVNGASATLGASGNATVAAVGTWPAGITLDPATGAITTTAAVAVGTYSVQYQLCDKNSPPNCATTTDTVSVIAAAVVARPIAGSAIVGKPSVAIGNVTAKGSVGGAAPRLGAAGNATVAKVGSWPGGLSLNASTGEVSTTATALAGNYGVEYRLCDRQVPAHCATSTATVTVAHPFTETQAGAEVVGDVEFDWARDGVFCASCNDGAGNAQVSWTDRDNHLWVGGVDPNTGIFTPASGRRALVDQNAFFWQDFGRGPTWSLSTPKGNTTPVSQLFYTRFQPGQVASAANAGAAVATYAHGAWTTGVLPGAASIGHGTAMPEASRCATDATVRTIFEDATAPSRVYAEELGAAVRASAVTLPFSSTASGIGERWVACTHAFTFLRDVATGGRSVTQVFWYDTDTKAVQQLTSDAASKQWALVFKAPEFLGQAYPNVLVTLVADRQVQVYRQTGVASNGAPTFRLYNTIASPDPAQPYLFDPQAFVHCSPTCQTYVLMGLGATAGAQRTQSQPTGLGVANIDAAKPLFKVLASAGSLPLAQRLNPKYFITSGGPVAYFTSQSVATTAQPAQERGIYFIDMQLGAPSGPCVGSSAEGGLSGPAGVCR